MLGSAQRVRLRVCPCECVRNCVYLAKEQPRTRHEAKGPITRSPSSLASLSVLFSIESVNHLEPVKQKSIVLFSVQARFEIAFILLLHVFLYTTLKHTWNFLSSFSRTKENNQ